MAMQKVHHDHPLCDLRSVDAIGRAQWDFGVCVDGMLGNVVSSCCEKLDELGVWEGGDRGWEPEESCEVRCASEKI